MSLNLGQKRAMVKYIVPCLIHCLPTRVFWRAGSIGRFSSSGPGRAESGGMGNVKVGEGWRRVDARARWDAEP